MMFARYTFVNNLHRIGASSDQAKVSCRAQETDAAVLEIEPETSPAANDADMGQFGRSTIRDVSR